MNIELLRKVQDAILLNPHEFDMADWIHDKAVDGDGSDCGTTACIFGWAATIHRKMQHPDNRVLNAAMRGEEILGLGPYWDNSNPEKDTMARKLAIHEAWPEEFSAAYVKAREANNHEAAALIAAARIEHFISTEGRE